MNEGNYRINYEQQDPKIPTPDIAFKPAQQPLKKRFKVSPCVLRTAECNLQGRQNAKRKNP